MSMTANIQPFERSTRLSGSDKAPMSAADPWLVHAEALLEARHLRAAISTFHIAERKGSAKDRCAAGRWWAFMLLGRFEDAWKESDAIRGRGAPDPHRFWNGEDLSGKTVIVRCLHGLEDTVQLLRYIPALRRRCERVIVEVSPPMLALAHMFDGVGEAITWGEGAPSRTPAWNVQLEATELPYIFRTQLEDLPFAANYLRAPESLRRRYELGMRKDRIQAGIVWSAGDWNPSRGIPLDALRTILQTPGVDFWNLQGGTMRDEWSSLPESGMLHDNPAACADTGLVKMAAFIANLDLVISVDTLAAHLAGAMGCPAWILLQHQADWRWMLDRSDSPWYPSASLFRQPKPGDWETVAGQVSMALASWIDSRFSRKAA